MKKAEKQVNERGMKTIEWNKGLKRNKKIMKNSEWEKEWKTENVKGMKMNEK